MFNNLVRMQNALYRLFGTNSFHETAYLLAMFSFTFAAVFHSAVCSSAATAATPINKCERPVFVDAALPPLKSDQYFGAETFGPVPGESSVCTYAAVWISERNHSEATLQIFE